jgi:hypothetical protein
MRLCLVSRFQDVVSASNQHVIGGEHGLSGANAGPRFRWRAFLCPSRRTRIETGTGTDLTNRRQTRAAVVAAAGWLFSCSELPWRLRRGVVFYSVVDEVERFNEGCTPEFSTYDETAGRLISPCACVSYSDYDSLREFALGVAVPVGVEP